MSDGIKCCTKCGVSKPVDEFHRHPQTRDRRASQCKRCVNARKVTRDCDACGKTYTSSRRNGRVCSLECRWFIDPRAKKSCAVPWHPCRECGVDFVKRGAVSYCSDGCRRAVLVRNSRERYRARYVKKDPYPCEVCGELIEEARGRARWCSRECFRTAPEFREQRRRENSNRRAAKKAGLYETVDPVTVFERDGWVCYLCDDPVDRDAVVPDLMAATMDHVVPLALGGDHTYANIKTAHFICNSRKSDTPLELLEVA